MGYGIFPVRMLVRGDHTMLHMTLAVVPPATETVVFSIDGSFAASVSVTGKDPKVEGKQTDREITKTHRCPQGLENVNLTYPLYFFKKLGQT